MVVALGPFDVRPVVGVDCQSAKDGKTKQADSESCDINLIMKRYEKTGVLPEMILENPIYGDFSSVPDFQTAFAIVSKAETQFAALDGQVRARFDM